MKKFQKRSDAEKKNEALNDQIEELNRILKATEKKTATILQEKEDVMKELDERQTLIQKNERECISLNKLLEIGAEKELAVLSDRQILENNFNKCIFESKKQQDILSHHQTQKDKELKSLKKIELQLKEIWDSLEGDKAKHRRLKSEEIISDTDARVLEECIAAENLLFKEQEKCRNELSALTQLVCLRADERQLKCRNVQKAKIQLQSIVKELKRKDREIIICKKMKKEMQKELQGFARMFDFMQTEKEKCMQLMRIAQWKARETEHRVKLLENNIENLKNAVITRESGLLLREREEELGFLYERINRQELLCRNGDIKMQVMDEKISFLKLKVAEKKREIKLCFKELTVKNALDAQLMRLQIQYSQCRDKIKQLEEKHGDATNESRKQEMGGKDPSPPELLKRIEQIEAELVQKEQRLLKIDFLCENISDLTDRIRTVVENGKEDTLQFARRINELQKKINDKTQEIRALFAELSMKQALVIKLQEEIRDKEQFVMTASLMISQGLPFPKEAEKERWKILRNGKMQKAAAEVRHPAEEEQGAVPGHAPTIPKEERLPPLQPSMAPFRPSEPSSSLRHFKKPPAKPSEI
uniref:Coiled-coil domain-containing protein 146 n=1 Tax=Catharus ustulatus TaxID=91951 RepID=A0A8C3UHC9_CATUS